MRRGAFVSGAPPTSQDTAAAQSTFQPLFGYMRGNFATELARNLVTLVTFRQRQRYALAQRYSCDHHRRLQ